MGKTGRRKKGRRKRRGKEWGSETRERGRGEGTKVRKRK